MMYFVEEAEMLVEDHPDVRSWVGQVRDVAYDVEDVLDEFVMHCKYHRTSYRWYGVFKKMYTKSFGVIKARHELATRIQEIKKRIIDISETHERYINKYQSQASPWRISSVKTMSYDKRSDALFLKESDLVGIEVPKKEVTDMLLSGDYRRNAISIVGMGGLGKTTLVKKVYDDIYVTSKFTNHMWITVSESFKLDDLFKEAVRQLYTEEGQPLPQDVSTMDINRLKLLVSDFLQTKKYFVVFDDVWKLSHWDAIHLAFPRNQFGSRVMITTRNIELGQAVRATEEGGSVYHLRPLLNEEATQLFCRKAFSGVISCPQHLKQISQHILLACQGLPLAIVVLASALATRSQRKEEWELFYKSLGAEMKRNNKLDPMIQLLSLSYYDLPNHLKRCLLYLSIFPEDAKIWNDDLAQLWIAEGFVEEVNGMTLEEVADTYLNELIDRCLVQLTQTEKQGSIKVVQVHDIIRHIIILKASEQNITTIIRGQEVSFQNNVRRLAFHGSFTPFNDNPEQTQSYCKSIRTLVLCKSIGGNVSEPFLSNLLSHSRKLLKVLGLTYAQFERIPDEIFKLFHLKYLNLNNTKVKSIPKSIGMLQSLQTLKLFNTRVTELPAEIQKLQHLRHLIAGRFHPELVLETFEKIQGFRAPFRIGNLKFLQQLLYIEADQVDNIRIVTEIGKLLQLRILGITKLKKEDGKELCSSLGNLTQLRELYVYSAYEEEFIDLQYLKSSHLPRLQILKLTGRLEKCPGLLSSLHNCTRIDLQNSKLNDDPLQCLNNLPNLITLRLTGAYQGDTLCFKAGGFPKLNNLYLKFLQELRWVTVEENAMPFLLQLRISACISMEAIPTGIENLMNLQILDFSNMSNELVNKLENFDKQSAAYKRILQIPQVSISTYNDGRWSEDRHLNKETGIFNSITNQAKPTKPTFNNVMV